MKRIKQKYRINWKNKTTGVTGHGEPIFTNREVAQDVADQANRRDAHIHHWVKAILDNPTKSVAIEKGDQCPT